MTSCPNCGGPVSDEARNCDFCHAPIATVRCGHCYHMSIPTALHCAGCGRELGLEPLGAPDTLRCPRCDVPLEVFRAGPGKLWDCGSCGGQFVEHALVRDLIERRELYGVSAPRRHRPRNPLTQPVSYVPCPACRELMHRRNFGGASGIVVDMCYKHGIWFDIGELPGVLGFVESGGLARARHRELEELERKKRAAPSTPIAPILPQESPLILDAEFRAGLLEDIAEAAVVLLDAVVGALRSRL
jgi:Zn-finger nucleic acid-binding protein